MSDREFQFVLLHGAGLGRWIWDGVVPHLNAPAEAVDLPGRGDHPRPGDVTLQQCIDVVASQMRSHSIIVGHSISAEVAMGVAAMRPRSVAAVVLVGGMVPESGHSFMSMLPVLQRIFLHVLLRFSRSGIRLPASLVKSEYCSDLSEERTAEVLANVVPEAPRLYLDRIDWRSIPDDVRRFYLKLLDDRSVKLSVQEEVRARINAVEWDSLPTGHLPMLSQPELLAESLNRLAREGLFHH